MSLNLVLDRPLAVATPPALLAQRVKLLERWDALRLPHQAFRAGQLVAQPGAPDRALIFVRYLGYADWDLASRRWLSDCVVSHFAPDGETLCDVLAVSHRLRPLTEAEQREVMVAAKVGWMLGTEDC